MHELIAMNKSRSFLAGFIAHPIASKTLLIVFILAGLTGMFSLRQEVFPPFAPNRIDMSMDIRGASAREVEQLVVLKVEQQLAELTEIYRIVANAYQDRAYFQIELAPDVDVNKALILIKSQIDGISSFPAYAEPPVFSVPKTTGPLLLINLHGNVSSHLLYEQALELSRQLMLLPGITLAEIEDAPEMELSVEVQPGDLYRYKLTLGDIAAAIRASSLNLSAGDINTTGGRLTLRSENLALNAHQFEKLVIKSFANGQRLTLAEIASVRVKPVEGYSISRFNGRPALTISIRRDDKTSLSVASDEVQQFLGGYQKKLGNELSVTLWKDDSREFTSRTGLLLEDGFFGFLIICLVMGIFVHMRVAFWTAVGIPVSMLGALGIMYLSGWDVSLNAITLFGFLIASGLIVDDAIVIGESINQETSRFGYTLDNVIQGAQRVAMPTTFGALTSIAAFYPLTMTEGKMGSQMAGIGMVVICCLAASIIVSKLILPNQLRNPGSPWSRVSWLQKVQGKANSGLNYVTHGPYKKILLKCLERPIVPIASILLLFVLSILVMVSGLVRTVTLPNIADYEIDGAFTIDPNLTAIQREELGNRLLSSLDRTNNLLKKQHQLEYNPIMLNLMRIEGDRIIFEVEINHDELAPFDAHEVANVWRNQVPKIPELASVSIASGPNSDEQVAIQLSSENLDDILQAQENVKRYLEKIPGVVDVRDNAQEKSTDILIESNVQGEAISATQDWLTNAVRSAFYGVEAQRIQQGDQESRVMVRYASDYRNSLNDLTEMKILLPNGNLAALDTVAVLTPKVSDSLIQRIDARRAITVYANTIGDLDAEGVAETVVEDFLPELARQYPGLGYSIEGEAKEAAKSISSLVSGSLLALFAMFALMAIPMKSYRYPFVILSILPFGFIGTVIGHLIFPIDYSLISMFGLIALMGVMINSSLLLVDCFNQNMELGLSKKDAITESCLRRFHPILLTALTTFGGLMPLLWETDPESLWLVPIAVSLGVGVVVSTALTLLLLPVLLYKVPHPGRKEIENIEHFVAVKAKRNAA